MYEYAAELISVHDGDTYHAKVDLGLDISVNVIIRAYGINSPELRTAEGKAALAYVNQWFRTHCPTGAFTLLTIKDKREKYGRYLGIITAPDNFTLNADIVTAGFAVTYFPKLVGPD